MCLLPTICRVATTVQISGNEHDIYCIRNSDSYKSVWKYCYSLRFSAIFQKFSFIFMPILNLFVEHWFDYCCVLL
jgi:hypothetical protein